MDVRLPDGTVIKNIPDGTTKAQLIQKLQSNGYDTSSLMDQPAEAAPPSGVPSEYPYQPPEPEVAPSFMSRVGGLLETPLAAGAGMLMGAAAPFAGIGATLLSGKYGTQEGIRAGEEAARKVQGMAWQPRTQTARDILSGAGELLQASGLQGIAPTNLMAGAAYAPAAVNALTREADLAKQAYRSIPSVAAKTAETAARKSAESWQNINRIEAAQDAQRLGIKLNPAISNPNKTTKTLDVLVGDQDVNALASKANLNKWTDIARNEIGIPPDMKLGPDAFEFARRSANAPYEKIRQIPQLKADDSIISQVRGLQQQALIGDPQVAEAARKMIDVVVGQLQQGVTGEQTIKSIRDLRQGAQRIKNNAVNPPTNAQLAVAKVQMGVADALENMVEGNLSGRALDEYRKARVHMAKTYAYEDAIDFNRGIIDPARLAKATNDNPRLQGDIAAMGRIAGNFPEIAQLDPQGTQTLARFSRFTAPGLIGYGLGDMVGSPLLGMAVGSTVGAMASGLGARSLISGVPGLRNFGLSGEAIQNRLAMPPDNRIMPNVWGPRPVAPPSQNTPAIYDPRNAVVPPEDRPNWVFGRPDADVRVEIPQTPPQLGAPSAESTMAAIRNRNEFDYRMQKSLAEDAEQAALAAQEASRAPTGRGTLFDLDPVTGKLKEVSAGLKGATPDIIESTGKDLDSAVAKLSSGQPFKLSAEEKISWDKRRVDALSIDPSLSKLNDRQIAEKMLDRKWVDEAIAKAREKAKGFDEAAKRDKDAQKIRAAQQNRDRLMDFAESLEEKIRTSRPVSSGSQGPKTREAIRNRLVGGENRNALND